MKLLIYGLHFKPDLIGIGKYSGEMADWFFNRGYDIKVITAPHFYPEWKQQKRLLFYKKESIPYSVWRCPIYVPKKPSGLTRILHSISFAITSFPMLIKFIFWKPDYILSIEPPFITSPLALLYSKIVSAKSILHIQDLEIDAAFSLDILRKGIFYKFIKKVERFFLKHFDVISTISTMMKKQIINKGINEDKIFLLPNWADINNINPTVTNKYLRKQFSIQPNQKVILYSGNIGEKQNLHLVIDTAEKKQEDKNDCVFLIVGDGAAKSRLIDSAKVRNINNVIFKPLQPIKDFAALLTLADIHLVTQNENISDFVLPSKLTSILSAGGTAIISAKSGSQLAQLVKEYELGYLIESGSMNELYTAINNLLLYPNKFHHISTNARKYAENNLAIDTLLSNFEKEVLM